MIRVSVKTCNSAPVKIKLSRSSESDLLYAVEIDRRRQNKPGQRESVFTREDVLGMICEALDNARSVPCLECFMTETAWAERVEE